MSAPKKITLAFDVYGTLLSTESIAVKLAEFLGEEKAKAVATSWRKYQLEYTWWLNSMGVYLDFRMVTRRALSHALADFQLTLTSEQESQIHDSYSSLATYDDVAPTLDRLLAIPDLRSVLFSNAARPSIEANLVNAADLAARRELFSKIVVVEDCRKYKPAPETYLSLAAALNVDELDADGLNDIWLVSGNAFDIVGGRAVGMNAIWVDRKGEGWRDNLMPGMSGGPSQIVTSLEGVLDVVEKLMKG